MSEKKVGFFSFAFCFSSTAEDAARVVEWCVEIAAQMWRGAQGREEEQGREEGVEKATRGGSGRRLWRPGARLTVERNAGECCEAAARRGCAPADTVSSAHTVCLCRRLSTRSSPRRERRCARTARRAIVRFSRAVTRTLTVTGHHVCRPCSSPSELQRFVFPSFGVILARAFCALPLRRKRRTAAVSVRCARSWQRECGKQEATARKEGHARR